MDGAEFVRSMYDAFNRRDFDYLLERTTDQTEVKLIAFDHVFRGPEGFREFTQGFAEAFPDIKIDVTNVFASGEHVAAEFGIEGTHTGVLHSPMGDIEATGKSIDYPVAEVWEVRDDRVVRLNNYTDGGTLMRQLGLA